MNKNQDNDKFNIIKKIFLIFGSAVLLTVVAGVTVYVLKGSSVRDTAEMSADNSTVEVEDTSAAVDGDAAVAVDDTTAVGDDTSAVSDDNASVKHISKSDQASDEEVQTEGDAYVYDPADDKKLIAYPEYLQILEDYETAIRKILMVEFTPFKTTQTALADVTGDGVPELFFVSQRSDAYNPHFLSVDLHVYGYVATDSVEVKEIYCYPRLFQETVDDTLEYSIFTRDDEDGFYLGIRTGRDVYHENRYHIADVTDDGFMSIQSDGTTEFDDLKEHTDQVLMGQLNLAEYGFSGYHVITRSYDDLTGYLNKELERLNSDEVKKKREQAEELARKWKYYYKAILRNLNIYKKMKTNAPQTGSSYTEFKGYQMGDMDGDGIPELIIDMYAQNVKSAGCFIFSYKDGKECVEVQDEIAAYMIHDVNRDIVFRKPKEGKGLIYDDVDYLNNMTHVIRATLKNNELKFEELGEYNTGQKVPKDIEKTTKLKVYEISNLNGVDLD